MSFTWDHDMNQFDVRSCYKIEGITYNSKTSTQSLRKLGWGAHVCVLLVPSAVLIVGTVEVDSEF